MYYGAQPYHSYLGQFHISAPYRETGTYEYNDPEKGMTSVNYTKAPNVEELMVFMEQTAISIQMLNTNMGIIQDTLQKVIDKLTWLEGQEGFYEGRFMSLEVRLSSIDIELVGLRSK